MKRHRIAIAGLGNCASAALQGFALHQCGKLTSGEVGLGPEFPSDVLRHVEFVGAFDIDRRKVGVSVRDAIFAEPNRVPDYGADLSFFNFPIVKGPTLDGVAGSMHGLPLREIFWPDETKSAVDVAAELQRMGATLLLCMLPTGAVEAANHYAIAACSIGVGFANGSATPVANRPQIQAAFRDKGLLLIGDDFKSQFGATYLNETLLGALQARSCKIISTTQSNIGGNTDFLNMVDNERRRAKERSKLNALARWIEPDSGTDASASIAGYQSDLGDTKIAEIKIEAAGFAGRTFTLRTELVVEDSPNAGSVIMNILAGAVVNAGGIAEAGLSISSRTMKSPYSNLE